MHMPILRLAKELFFCQHTHTMRKTILIIIIAAFSASIAWLVFKPDYEPLISSLLTLGGLISFILIKPNDKKEKLVMKQKAGKKSKQYQSGGDMTINH
jgi:hypothetical protein